jgi:hypothetical protein
MLTAGVTFYFGGDAPAQQSVYKDAKDNN